MALDLETRQQLLDTVARFVRERLVPNESKLAEHHEIPGDILQEMRELGLFGISIPTEYGGLGLTMEEEAMVVMELCQASPVFRSAIGTNVGIGSQGIVMFGRDDQKQDWLPKLASGEAIASFALTEPEAGSDAASLKTTAIRDGDSYIVNGTKRFIGNADKASVFTLMARTNPDIKGAKGISAFAVPANTPGLTVGPPEKKMGLIGTNICDVIFEDCRIPASTLIGEREGEGFKLAMQVLDKGRLHISGVAVGVAKRLVQEMTVYAAERKQFGQRIGDFQLIQGMLADSQTEMYAGECMVLDTARKFDAKQDIAALASCCKLFCSEMVGRVADRAVQVFGGAGYIADYGIERFYRDVRVLRIYEGTSQIQQVVIARSMLKNI